MKSLVIFPLLAALILACLTLTSCWLTREGTAFLAMQARAKPVSALLADPTTSASRKDFFLRVERLRRFAIEELGMKNTKNYTTFIELPGDRVATVVQACAELSFQRYLWSYPFVGKLPYKGFFNPADAEVEAAKLKKEGFDVIVRGVDAFSTLGWFRDPLYSFMEKYGEGELAELIIHEQTHATVFSKREGSFNEELATFVGRAGAELWLQQNFGPGSAELTAYNAARADAKTFAAFLAGTATELEGVYESKIPEKEKREDKARILRERAEVYQEGAQRQYTGEGYRKFRMDRVNNAFLDLYRLYEGEPQLYADYLRVVCAGDLRRFIGEAARIAKLPGDPTETMRKELGAARGSP